MPSQHRVRGKSREIEFLTDFDPPLLNEIKNCMNLIFFLSLLKVFFYISEIS